jgi:hypothetical protein
MTKRKIKTNNGGHNTTQRMENLDTGNIRHTIHRTKAEINTTQHNTENGHSRHWQHKTDETQDEDKNKHNTTQRMNNLDTGNIRNTRHRMKTKINTTQHRE